MHPQIQTLIDRRALFVINHSGGKDSQAMTAYLRSVIPADLLVIVHAELPEVDWDGIPQHIEATACGIPVHYTRATKTFFEMVDRRGMFPTPQYRQCTSDLKRGPIERTIRRTGRRLIVNCMGMRAQESDARRKLAPFKLNVRNSVAGREWYDWLPIHDWHVSRVWQTIADAGQTPHPAYAAGMTRLSCVFCIMASKPDLRTAAKLRPDLLARYVATERRLNQTMAMPDESGRRRFLDEIVS